jgi:hypothetical protein
MQRLKVSGAVRPLQWPLGVKVLKHQHYFIAPSRGQRQTGQLTESNEDLAATECNKISERRRRQGVRVLQRFNE